jgi:hypothetical protein
MDLMGNGGGGAGGGGSIDDDILSWLLCEAHATLVPGSQNTHEANLFDHSGSKGGGFVFPAMTPASNSEDASVATSDNDDEADYRIELPSALRTSSSSSSFNSGYNQKQMMGSYGKQIPIPTTSSSSSYQDGNSRSSEASSRNGDVSSRFGRRCLMDDGLLD